ncbi:uncharacterized protein [Parasteatoda tepidariorum]|uniref:uncharacterized protein n=1 Tax=Parasteatoda tepidariorum TaxID=114398 RepID=UPI001C727CA7|nr:TNF receptor-associated factor family protein DDB_G0272829 [Parasteatoda tepidariorum]
MAPPVWAYQVDNFIPPPDEELVCSICQAIFCDPVQSPCNHVFCRTCIAKWLETNRNCPICRKRTTRTTLQEVVPIVKNMIMKLILRCHNSERGCKAKFPLESCESHVKDCPYELVQCKNKPCKQMFVRKDIKDHETNSCFHSVVRCDSCRLKVSCRSLLTHNCVDELRVRLKGKDEKLKEYREKLKKLKEELKSIRESEDFTSDSSIVSISPTEILFNFTENSNLSEFSSISSDDSTNQQSDESEANWSSPRPTRESMMFELEQLQERINDHFGQIRSAANEQAEDNNSSIEYPRASSPASLEDSSVLAAEPAEVFVEEEPESIVRPAKRRLLTQILDSTDEEEQLEAAPQPSRKRTFQHLNKVDSTSGNNIEPVAGPSYRSSNITDSSTSNNDSSPSNQSSRFKLRPKLKSRCADRRSMPMNDVASPTAPNGSIVFERTRSLLEQYNLESDPEWLPPTALEDDSSDSNLYEFRRPATSTDDSSSSYESASSYEDGAVGRTSDLLNSFYASSDSDEWLPPGY